MKNEVIMALVIMLLAMPVFATSKPLSINPVNMFDQIHGQIYNVAGQGIEGTACTVEYASTGSYCSGTIREYYQCLHQTVDTMTWQQRSEDCLKYSAICIAGDCRGGLVDSTFSWILVGMSALIITVLSVGLKKFTKTKTKTIVWIDAILILLLVFVILLGGV